MKKEVLNKDVFVIENFLSEKQCDDLIIYSEQRGYEEATVTTNEGQKMIKGIRNNQRVLINDPQLGLTYWEKIKPFIDINFPNWNPIGVNEQFRFYKYDVGERFNKHRDGRYRRNDNEESKLTFMIYLNQDFEGGETEFDDFTIQPKTGTALIFTHELKHKGCMINNGSKYAIRTDIMYQKILNNL